LIYSLASTPSRAPDKAERGAVWERLRSATYSRGQCGALLDLKGWKSGTYGPSLRYPFCVPYYPSASIYLCECRIAGGYNRSKGIIRS
jgi:hypothetical protein